MTPRILVKPIQTFEPLKYNQAGIEDLCKEWQRTLRLEDWDVIVKIERASEFDIEDSKMTVAGECSPQMTKKIASIRILDPIDYKPRTIQPQDQELTLVHELLHIHFFTIMDDVKTDKFNEPLEVVIHRLSEALVALKRGVAI